MLIFQGVIIHHLFTAAVSAARDLRQRRYLLQERQGFIRLTVGGLVLRLIRKHVGVFKNSGTPKWKVYIGKPY